MSKHQTDSKIVFVYTNATSLENKLNELKLICEMDKPHIFAVTETWFRSTSLSNMDGYNVYRKDRLDGKGGGVALYVSKN